MSAQNERVRIAGRLASSPDAPVWIGRTEMSRKLGEKLVERLNRDQPEFVRWLVPVEAQSAEDVT